MTSIRTPGSTADNISVAYDSSNRVTSVTRDGVTRNYSWTSPGGSVQVVVATPNGNTQAVTTPSVGQPASVTNPLSQTTAYQYDGSNRVIRETRPEGDYTFFTRDARGNITETRRVAKAGSGLADIVETANYDATCVNPFTCNQPNYTVDALGNRTDYTYSPTHGQVTRVQMPSPGAGQPRPEINYTYSALYAQVRDGAGNLVNAATPQYQLTLITSCAIAATCAGTANESRVTIAYNNPNLLVSSITTANGSGAISATVTYGYDAHDNLVSTDGPLPGSDDTTIYIYDALDRRRGVIGPDPDGAGSRPRVAERYTFDTASRLTKVERGTVTAATPAALDAMVAVQTLDLFYDANGRVTRQTASAGGTAISLSQTSYDAQGRVTCTALRMNPAVYAALPADACIQSTNGTNGADRISRNTYDAADRVTLVESGVGTTAIGNEVATGYTANGQTAWVQDGENNRTTYVYDGHDRLSQTRYPVAAVGAQTSNTADYEQLTYDVGSRVTQRRLRDGTVINLSYDNLGRLLTRDLPGTQPDATYTYDLAGRMVQAVQDGRTLTFTINALGQLMATSGPNGTLSYLYDAAGRRTRLTYADGFYVTYDYDVVGNVTAIRENGAASGVGVLATYGYDSLGRRSSVTFGNGTAQTLGFNNADQLTSLANNLAGTAQDLSVSYSFNPAGQIAQQTRSADAYAWNGHYNIDRLYSVNGLNQILTAGQLSLSYDARGNLTGSGAATYAYNADNLMVSASNGTSLGYDPLGRLAQTVLGANTTRMAYDGASLIAEYNGSGTLLRRYVHGPGVDEPIVWYEGSGTGSRRFLMRDERGSIVSVADASGTTMAINSYDEYGIPSSTNLGRFGYTGQAWLPDVGMYYYRARIYSPTLGRFMQTDPIGYGDGMNLYAYVGNDPVNFLDPTGLASWGSADGSNCLTTDQYHRNIYRNAEGEIASNVLHYDGTVVNCVGPDTPEFGFSGGGRNSVITGRRQNDENDIVVTAPQNNQCLAPSGGQSAIPSGAGAISFSDAEVIARRIGNEELARTQRITDNYRLGGHNDIYDAERHARWVYRMSVAIGSGWAGMFATAHEGEGMVGGQPFIEMRMDLNNNSLGMNAARNGTGMPTRSTPGLMYIRDGRLIRQTC